MDLVTLCLMQNQANTAKCLVIRHLNIVPTSPSSHLQSIVNQGIGELVDEVEDVLQGHIGFLVIGSGEEIGGDVQFEGVDGPIAPQ